MNRNKKQIQTRKLKQNTETKITTETVKTENKENKKIKKTYFSNPPPPPT